MILAMQQIQFGSLPALAKVGIGAGILFIWVLFEREVIERFGIYHYMPLYRVEGICAWDILVCVRWRMSSSSCRPNGNSTREQSTYSVWR